MARRSHLTHVGCIACDEMEELGAGEREGWLDDPGLLAALHPHALALAHSARSLVLVLGWDRDPDPSSPRQPLKIRPSLAADEGHISAIEWLPFGDLLALALATSAGHLFVYSLTGDLIHKQIIHSGRVLRLRFRETKVGSSQDSVASMELCVVLPGVIARFDGSDIQSLLQRWFQEERSRIFENRFQNRNTVDENSYGRIPFQLWNVSKFGSCADAAITGLMPPPLLELQSSQRYYCAVAIGEDAAISAYRLSEDRSRSLVGAILSKVVPATFSTLASFSKMLWRSEQTSPKKPRLKPQPFAKASPLTCLKDPPRKGEKLTLSPGGTLAAITDSLGRILLLDTQALVVVRLWKGYRDACCLFIEMLVNRDKASSSAYYEHTKGDYCLCLAIHAPRKGIIEGPSLEFVGDYWDQLGFSVVHFLSSSIKSSYLVTIIKSGRCELAHVSLPSSVLKEAKFCSHQLGLYHQPHHTSLWRFSY
ncbi:rab3 GTPase-activating protein non-catalytic subunit-like isoform X2 [Phoenix dactylifera]|uniref:Rab3 GTPase-activating protein non-catalytic subunit-like isoform X2 n=1 Tax=Phoenix dactylifera TaxID=42345 RepID=A0A8B9AVY7_PHODC|nr:rab3 GTPase-activating protein non-catalytic subunit-like isoform X2 [Phoenix dactylifera]